MDDWITWAGIGFAVAVAWYLRTRGEDVSPPIRTAWRPSNAPTPVVSRRGIFQVRVIALEYDDGGPVLFVNGEFANGDDPLTVEEVEAEVVCGADRRQMVWFDPNEEGRMPETRMASLVEFTGPVSLAPGERGLFRIPLFDPEAADRMADTLDRLDRAADELIDRFDREWGEYALDDDALEEMTRLLVTDRAVKGIAMSLNDEAFYRAGSMSVNLRLIGAGGEPLDDIVFRVDLAGEEADTLHANVDAILANSLRGGLDLEGEEYLPVVIDQDRLTSDDR
jgi:hypothetical protein